MSKLNHTPGPWKVTRSAASGLLIQDEARQLIAELEGGNGVKT